VVVALGAVAAALAGRRAVEVEAVEEREALLEAA
jgi:hypothetical protein